MRILVAGGTGTIGRQLVPQLVASGATVSVLARSEQSAAALDREATAVIVDALDPGPLERAVVAAHPDVVINELTDLPDRLDPRQLFAIYAANDEVRRVGTTNLLGAAHAAGAQRFVQQSVAFWYTPNGERLRNEDDPMDLDAPEPIGAAVRTMVEVEQAVRQASGLTGIVLRYGQLYGPGTWYAPDGDIGSRVRRRQYPIIGQGAGVTSFLHVADAASATLAALDLDVAGIYNVVDDEPANANTWLPAYAAALDAPPPRRVATFLARLLIGRPLVTWSARVPGATAERFKAATGWRPGYPSWRDGFRQAIG
jgi:2-alkyl-3-oxoalkanoate reductase